MSEPKQYSLKPNEKAVITTMINQHQSLLHNFLSFIAIERLAQEVTETTSFKLGENLENIVISTPEDKPDEPTETAKALKGKK